MEVTIQYPWFKRSLPSFYNNRLLQQLFGEGPFDRDFLPFLSSTFSPFYRSPIFRTLLDSGISEVHSDKDCFTITLNVKHFSPEELTVKIVDDFVNIHGKHLERQEEDGWVSREFHRSYRLPSNLDQSAFSCSMSSDGFLSLCCPRFHTTDDLKQNERSIPVSRDDKQCMEPESRAA
ncbi:alpha-crystallin A chain [Amblyraja radiata]|uniref:alpha-crystallin A chain n=1 Tax=Amblyraja radiata TaxID=386614 RepID=UPI00140310C2|nr:alpha-crystallin A chain [Amblyraja radiata]